MFYSSLSFAAAGLISLAVVAVSGQDLVLNVPSAIETNTISSLNWSGGSPPYTVTYTVWSVLGNPNFDGEGVLQMWSNETSVSYNVTIPGKSVVGFALFDDSGLATTSPNFTVADPFTLNSPNSTEYNLPMSIAWLGGVAPYTVLILSPDTNQQFGNYTGSALSKTWTLDLNPGDTFIVRGVDTLGAQITNGPFTIQSNPVVSAQSVMSILSTASIISTSSVVIESQSSTSTLEASLSMQSVMMSMTMAMETTSSSTSPPSSQSSTTVVSGASKSHSPLIAGATAGGCLAAAALLVLCIFITRLRRKRSDIGGNDFGEMFEPKASADSALPGHPGHHYHDSFASVDSSRAVPTGNLLSPELYGRPAEDGRFNTMSYPIAYGAPAVTLMETPHGKIGKTTGGTYNSPTLDNRYSEVITTNPDTYIRNAHALHTGVYQYPPLAQPPPLESQQEHWDSSHHRGQPSHVPNPSITDPTSNLLPQKDRTRSMVRGWAGRPEL